MDKFTAVANIAAFLAVEKGSVLATWKGSMPAKQQRELFGMFHGKGELTINGENETIMHTVKRGFGGDYEVTYVSTFSTLGKSSDERFDAFYKAEAM